MGRHENPTVLWFALILFAVALGALAIRAAGLPRDQVPWWRRVVAIVVLAVVCLVPVGLAFVLPVTLARGAAVTSMVTQDESGKVAFAPIPLPGLDLVVVVASWLAVLAQALVFVRPPRRFRPSPRLLPATDAGLLARVESMSRELGLRPPLLLETRDDLGLRVAACAIDGLLPTIVVDAGVLHRLEVQERDALLAHELGHMAAHVACKYLAAVVFVGVAAVWVSALLAVLPALVFLLAARVLVHSLRSHREEIAADRTGARLVGAVVMARALDQTHAANFQLDASPWLYALLSHPHLVVRAARLRRVCDPGAANQIAVDEALLRRCTLARRLGIAFAVGVLAGSVWLGAAGHDAIAAMLALAVAAAPGASLLALQPWQLVRDARGIGLSLLTPLGRWRLGLLCAGGINLVIATSVQGDMSGAFTLVATALLLLAVVWGRGERRARRRLVTRLLEREWRGWRTLYEALPRRLRNRPDLWLMASEVAVALGDPLGGDAEIERLLVRWPGYHMARITRVARLRASQPQQAVRCARELRVLLPTHPYALATLASALRSAGAGDEAWQIVQTAMRQRPNYGVFHALACRIAVARGDLPAARAALAEAQRQAPGELRVLLAQADLEVLEGNASASATLQRVRGQFLREPFSYLEPDVEALERRLVGAAG